MRIFFYCTVLCVNAAVQSAAQLTARQAIDRHALTDPRWQPHGAHVAVTVSEYPRGTTRLRHIWLADAASGTARQFTSSAKSEWAPRWSPDGRTLAFLSDRADRAQVWLVPIDGGEAIALTNTNNLKARISEYAWSPDGRRIAILGRATPDSLTNERIQTKDDARVVDKDDARNHIWIVDVATKRATPITAAPWDIDEMRWAPDGTRLIVAATNQPESDQYTRGIYSILLDGASASTLTMIAMPRGPFGNVTVSPTGDRIAWVGARVDGPSPHDVYVASLNNVSGTTRNTTGSTLDRLIESYSWHQDGSLTALVQDGFSTHLIGLSREGRATPNSAFPVNPTSFDETDAGDVAFVGERATVAPELWIARSGQAAVQVTHVNDDWKSIPVVAPSFIHWKAADGLNIEGALLLPPSRTNGQRLPTIVLPHGGPAGAWSDAFEPWGQMLVSRGYAVFYPNPRGSTGYGQKFLEANRADWGGADFRDIMSGVDKLVGDGVADSTRLGIGGWSYGGYMAEWAITQTNRFKAAIAGAGMSDLATEYGTEDIPSYDEWYSGIPYENAQVFARMSPLTHIAKARTPTLILQGEEDVTDPIGQSTSLYRALKRYKVPTELVLYPREGHGLGEEKHLIDRLNRVVEWYQRWIHVTPGNS